MNDVLESDWKQFRALLPVWRERYLAEKNQKITALLSASGQTETERFWNAEELLRKEAKTLQRCLDDIRRSRMLECLWAMRGAGMICRDDLASFSQELQEKVFFEQANP